MVEYICYEDLVKKFNSQLVDKLRLHGSDDEVLSLWVPDDDVKKSFHNLVSALHEAKKEDFKISFSKDIMSQNLIDELQLHYARKLNIDFHADENRIFCFISKIQESTFKGALLKEAQPPEIVIEVDYNYAEVFQHNVLDGLSSVMNEFSKKNMFNKPLLNENNDIIITSSVKGLSISISFNTKDLTLDNYSYSGKNNKKVKAICEMIGKIGIGLPVHDFCQHIVLKSIHEFFALSPNFDRPAILLPNNVGFEFMFVNKVIQNIYLKLLEKKINGVQNKINFYDNPPSKNWLNISAKERDQRVIKSIRNFEVENNLKQDSINYHNITLDLDNWPIRTTISITDDIAVIDRPNILRLLEKYIRLNVEEKLQVFYEESKDKNKIRRL